MKKIIFTFLLCLTAVSVFSQNNKLDGTWILDKYIYSDGRPLEINDNNFSSFAKYEFDSNKMRINGLEIPIKITSNIIQTDATKFEYGFDNKYLLLQMQGDKKIACLLKPETFIEMYPEFQSEKINYNESEFFKENQLIGPDFNYNGGFNSYWILALTEYDNFSTSDYYFDIQFILTKDSKIRDIKILKGSTDDFNKKVTMVISNSQKYFKNTTGKDFLMNRKFKMNNSGSKNQMSKIDKQVEKIDETGSKYFTKNDFANAIKTYEKLELLGTDSPDNPLLQTSFKRLGISYLAINDIDKACKSFKKAGNLNSFDVRNYLITFCSKK